MNHQDWSHVVLKKNSNIKKQSVQLPEGHKEFKKLDSNDPDAPKCLGLSVGKQIEKARLKKGLKQKELAIKINVIESVIRDYETGKIIPSKKVTQQICKVLELKLTN